MTILYNEVSSIESFMFKDYWTFVENSSNDNITCLIFVENNSIDDSMKFYPTFLFSESLKVLGIESVRDNTLELKMMNLHWFEIFMLRFIELGS